MRNGARVLENLIILALAIIFIGGIVLFGTEGQEIIEKTGYVPIIDEGQL